MADIHVGGLPIQRSSFPLWWAMLCRSNPASEAVTLSQVEIYGTVCTGTFTIATLHENSTNNFTPTDYVTVGAFSAGYNNFDGLELDANEGDVLGYKYDNYALQGGIDYEYNATGAAHYSYTDNAHWYDQTIDWGASNDSPFVLSIYGTGEAIGGTVITVSDDGAGSDSLGSGIRASVPLSDAGNSADAVSMITVTIPISESGAGIDAITLAANLIAILENGVGIDGEPSINIIRAPYIEKTVQIENTNQDAMYVNTGEEDIFLNDSTPIIGEDYFLAGKSYGDTITLNFCLSFPIEIPAGAKIISANLQGCTLNPTGEVVASTKITAEKTDAPTVWVDSDVAAYLTRHNNKTTAYKKWDGGNWTILDYIDSPDLTEIVQEVLDASNGVTGLSFFIDDDGSVDDGVLIFAGFNKMIGIGSAPFILKISYYDPSAPIICINESGAGADNVPAITVTFKVSDIGAGNDIINIIKTILIQLAEAGAGSDVVIRYRNADARCLGITFKAKKGKITITT
jgi:hypothetical protein